MKKIQVLIAVFMLTAGSLSAQTIVDSVLYIADGTTEIKNSAYYGRTDFNKVVIPSSVTQIGGLAFHNCSKLKEIEIPASVDTIGNAVFQNCTSLTKVTLCNGLKNLSYRLFKDCVSLTEITIPSTVIKFGNEVFDGCKSLSKITVDRYSKSHTFFSSKYSGILAFTDKEPAISREEWFASADYDIVEDSVLYIKPGTTSIKGGAYSYRKDFVKAVVPSTVTEIGGESFFSSKIREITIPGSVQIIKNSAFYCSQLEKAILEEGVKEIDSYAFNTYRKLYIYVPNSVDTLAAKNGITNGEAVWTVVQGSYAEEYVNGRCSYNIDYTQPYSAYSGETALKISINGNVPADYFKNCPNLQSVDIGPDVTEIPSGLFTDNLTLRAKRNTYADTWAKQNGYYLCGVLADLNVYTKDASKQIEEDFTRILCDDDSYVNWTSYKFVIQQPLKLEEVDDKLVLTSFMLYPCENVTVTDKDGKALISNKTIQPLTRTELCDFDFLTDSVENYTLTTDDAFYKRLVSIPTEWSISFDGSIYRPGKYEKDLIRPMRPVFAREYIAGIYNVAYIAGSPEYAARCYQAVEEQTLVTNEELTEFLTKEQMDNLLKKASKWSIMLGRCQGGLSVAGGQAIWLDNSWLLGLSCGTPNSFWHEHSHNMGWGHEDGNMCNDGRPAPYNLDWPGIGNQVYKEEFKKGTPPYLEGKLFFNSKLFSYDELHLPDIPNDVVIDSILYITEGVPIVDSHKNQTDFTKVEIPESVELIKGSALYGTKVEEIELPSSVRKIGSLAFHSCAELESVTIPDGVKEIGDAAFQNCTSLASAEIGSGLRQLNFRLFKGSGLTEIAIPANVKAIGKECFQDCANLKKVTIADGVRKIDNSAFKNTAVEEIEIPATVTKIGTGITPKNTVWIVEKDSYAHKYAVENNQTFRLKSGENTDNNENEGNNTETSVTEQFAHVNIYAHGRTLVVENATDEIRVYDVMGRLVCRDEACRVRTEIPMEKSGVYVVKIGNMAKRVIVE